MSVILNAVKTRNLILFLCGLGISVSLVAEPLTMSAPEWAMPRSGEAMVKQPAMSATAEALLADADTHLTIRYPGGDEGSLWASEVSAWFVALGIPSQRISLMPGAAALDRIELDVVSENPSNPY